MAFQPAPGIAQFNVRAELDGELVENVLHYANVLAPEWSAAQLTSFAETIGLAWVGGMLPLLSADYLLREVEARDLSVDGGFTGIWTAAAGTRGQNIAPAAPNSIAFCLTKETGRAGRSFRGRVYICGLARDAVNDNRISPALAENLRGAFQAIQIQPLASTIGGVVLSRKNAKVTRPVAIGTPVTAIAFRDTIVDSQRRRLPRA